MKRSHTTKRIPNRNGNWRLMLPIVTSVLTAIWLVWPHTRTSPSSDSDVVVDTRGLNNATSLSSEMIRRHSDRTIEPELNDQQYREKLLRDDLSNVEDRQTELERRRRDYLPLSTVDMAERQQHQLKAFIASAKHGGAASNPQSLRGSAKRQLEAIIRGEH